MQISEDIFPYSVFADDTIMLALDKMNKNPHRTIFVTSSRGELQGALTDGDFRRWIVKQSQLDLYQRVSLVAHLEPIYVLRSDNKRAIQGRFSTAVKVLPVLDADKKLVAIATPSLRRSVMGSFDLNNPQSVFIIAEIGNNHNGSLITAKSLIDAAVEAGADCVKFQMRDMDSLYLKSGKAVSEDLGSEYTLDLLQRFQLSRDEMFQALDYAKTCGLVPLCTPFDLKSLERLDEFGIEGFKIASADLTNHDLLLAAARTGKPLVVSTGMSTEQEIADSCQLLRENDAVFSLLHCNSTYPAPVEDVNLSYLATLKQFTGSAVGYSGHERGFEVCIAAVALGAKIIEKHFTFDRSSEGNDHRVSLLPNEFREMVGLIRNVSLSLGQSTGRVISQGERLNREVLAKSIVAKKIIRKGTHVTEDMLDIRSPGRGLQPSRMKELLGVTLTRDMVAGDFFFESDILGKTVNARNFVFERAWGIPVRYHDFQELVEAVDLGLVELHLSYRDLDLDPALYVPVNDQIELVVHSPELFSGDHVMDLSSEDAGYRRRSVGELTRVIEHTVNLKTFFPGSLRPKIIINAGGFSEDGFISVTKKKELYDRIGDALEQISNEEVEVIVQTMPPFPWHFGGQRFHNLFVDPNEIKVFCEEHKARICYDVSHSQLACNYFGWSLEDFTRLVGPYVAHLHLVDASGNRDEGLQIGEGVIDFAGLSRDLRKYAPIASFIPEIWQGHKNRGEGFWTALDKLENFSF